MDICLQEITFYVKNKENGATVPHFSIIVLLYLIAEYAMWTASCFSWENPFLDPYFIFTIIASVLKVMLVWGAQKYYGISFVGNPENELVEFRYQILFQAIVSFLISVASMRLCFGQRAKRLHNRYADWYYGF